MADPNNNGTMEPGQHEELPLHPLPTATGVAWFDALLHRAGLHALHAPIAGEDGVPTFEGSQGAAITPTPGFVVTGRPHSLVGARGRDPGGYPKIIPAGVPPAQAGEFHRVELPKSLELPARPYNFVSFLEKVPTGNTGEQINEDVGFPIRTIQIDNYTSIWLRVWGAERYVPPTTMGWQFPVARASTQIRVVAQAPPNFTQPAFTAGGIFSVFLYENFGSLNLGLGLNPVP